MIIIIKIPNAIILSDMHNTMANTQCIGNANKVLVISQNLSNTQKYREVRQHVTGLYPY